MLMWHKLASTRLIGQCEVDWKFPGVCIIRTIKL